MHDAPPIEASTPQLAPRTPTNRDTCPAGRWLSRSRRSTGAHKEVKHLALCLAGLVAVLATFPVVFATGDNPEAARYSGTPLWWTKTRAFMISSLSGLLPNMGGDPMLKAFVICVVAGLGNVYGAAGVAIALGLLEAIIQYVFGVQYSFAILLLIVIAVLIWRPAGLFGRAQVVRL